MIWSVCGFSLTLLCACRQSDTAPPAPPTTTSAPSADTGPWLVDVTREAGIDFVHDARAHGEFLFPEINGAGCAFLDYNNDGWLDVFFVQSCDDLKDPSAPRKTCKLYRNRGDGTFEDVTDATHAGGAGYGQGLAVGDYDNDGWVDIYIANAGPNVLLHNVRGEYFEDATAKAGVGDPGWAIPAAFLDYDNDGWLDLYVGNYVIWSPETDLECNMKGTGIRDYCGPANYTPQRDVMYRNRGDGTFEDVTLALGLAAATGPAMSAICADYNNDAWIDLYIANDSFANQLWMNDHGRHFTERGAEAGCAVNEMGGAESSMGCNSEDLDGDGDLEIFLVHFAKQTNTIYFNENGFFEDRTARTGLAPLSFQHTSFGAFFFDLFNEGEFYVYVGNGKAVIVGKLPGSGNPYVERDQLFRWAPNEMRFYDVTDQAGPAMDVELVDRGVIGGDYDNDGDIDILLSHNNGPARLLRNDAGSRSGNHWLMVRCLTPDGQRDCIGAQVSFEASGRQRRRDVIVNYSYACAADPRLHFGLGKATRADRITVTWPGGARTVYNDIRADQVFVVRQPAPAPTTQGAAHHE